VSFNSSFYLASGSDTVMEPDASVGLACPLSCGKLIFNFLLWAIIATPNATHVPEKWHRVPCPWQCHSGSLIEHLEPPLLISRQINTFGCFRNTWGFGTRNAFSIA
jgi:hypothetical protein